MIALLASHFEPQKRQGDICLNRTGRRLFHCHRMHTFQTRLTFQITSSDRLEVDDSTRAAENNEHFSEEEISVRSADGIDALKLEMRSDLARRRHKAESRPHDRPRALRDRCTRSTFGKEHGQLVLTTARDTCARELIVSIKPGIRSLIGGRSECW